MTNSPEEHFWLTPPEYQTAVGELFDEASNAMDANADFVVTRDNFKGSTLSSLRLESDSVKVITLERSLKNPLPKNPDWSSVTPSIRKTAPDIQGNRYNHEYINVHGLIIDRKSYEAPKTSKWGTSNASEDELNTYDVRQLTYEIRTWVPMEQVQTKRSRVARAIVWLLNKV